MGRPEGALSFCGYVASTNATNATIIFYNECFIDAIRTIPHVVFTFFIIPPLIALNKGQAASYHAKTWVHFPWHDLRWVLSIIMMIVHILAIGEGFLSDSLYDDSHLHLFLPGIMSLMGTGMAIAYYHNIEVWNSPKFLQLPLLLYWTTNLITEVLKVICLSFKDVDDIHLRVHINRTVVVLYSCLLLLEIDVRRQMRLFICFKKPNLLVPPEDLVTICYIHDKVSLLSRATFFWIQRMIRRGFHGYIDWRDLGDLPKEDQIICEMKKVEEQVNIKQLYTEGLTVHTIYKQILRSSYPTLATGIITGLGGDIIGCFLPVILSFIIMYLQQDSSGQTSLENAVLPTSEQYITAASFFSSGYILLTLLTMLLIIMIVLKEASNQMMNRISLRLNNIIKMIILKKLAQVRLKTLPMFINSRQSATELVNGDWSPLVFGLFNLFRYFAKMFVCYGIIFCYYGVISLVILYLYLGGLLLLLYVNHLSMNNKPETNGDNLRFIRQFRLQGHGTITAITDLIFNNQKQEMIHLRKPILFYSLFVGVTNATVIAIGIMLFPSIPGYVPATSSIVVIFLLLHYMRSAIPDLMGFVDIMNTRKSLRKVCSLLMTPPVLGRALTENDTESSEACEPVTFSIELTSRTPSPTADNNPCDKRNPFMEAVSRDLPGTSTSSGGIELTEVTPMLGTITEEGGMERKKTDKCVKCPETSEKAPGVQGSLPNTRHEESSLGSMGYGDESSGGISHMSDLDGSVLFHSTKGVGVAIETWNASCQDTVSLKNISLRVDDGKLTVITGPKMSGKATLLDCLLLGNVESISGEVIWKGDTKVSCSGYPAWIMESSVMENIIFGQIFDKHRYKRVIKACALQSDLNSFPDKDLTILGRDERVRLTDGQRNRITLARALYSKSDIVILNEPLSCMNVNKGSEIFEDGILKFLLRRKRTVIMATQQIQFFPFAHMIYRIENGQITHRGTLAQIKEADSRLFNRWQNIAKLVRQESYATLSLSINRETTSHIRKKHDSASKSLDGQTSHHIKPTLISPVNSPVKYHTQVSHSSDNGEKSGDMRIREHMYSTQSSRELQDDLLDPQERGLSPHKGVYDFDIPKDHLGHAHLDYVPDVVWKLMRKSWSYILTLIFVLLLIMLTVVTYYYVLLWTVLENSSVMRNYTGQHAEHNLGADGTVFDTWICSGVVFVVLTLLLQIILSHSGLQAASMLHNNVTEALLNCSISSLMCTKATYFLSQLQETKGIKQLQSLCDSLAVWVHCIGLMLSMVVLVSIACPFAVIPALALLVPEGFAIVAHYCTARQLFALHQSAESSLLSNVHSFMKGLSVIRAHSQEEHMLKMLCERIDAQTNVQLWRLALNSWLSIRTHVLAAVLFMCCGLGFIHDGSQESKLSMYAVTAFLLCLLHFYLKDLQLRSMYDVTNQCLSLGSLFRISDVITDAPRVSSSEGSSVEHLPSDWPKDGCVTFVDVTLKYDPEDDPAIIGADFCISPGDKFGICGATGSGKSTLIMSMVRISEVAQGTITIDNQCLAEISGHVLCSRITYIPHDAVIFNQSVRFNLSPDGSKQDTDIWNVLEKVELKNVIETFPGQLDQVISEEYLNSTEKQQLFLAYALLRGSRIIVLDEVIRPENNIIRRVLDILFLHDWKHITVIMVTNQADFLLSMTQVIVLESGHVVEQGKPAALVKNKSPFFPPVDLH